MILVYVDESYTKSFYWIAAVLCPEGSIGGLTEALDAVAADASLRYGVTRDAELHGYELFHGRGDWEAAAKKPRARIGVYADALRCLADSDIELMVRGVASERLVQRYSAPRNPHQVVLSHLLERVDERIESHYGGTPGLVIADEVDGADDYRRDLWHFQRHGTDGYRPRRLRHLVDTIHFAPSRASRLVQASDLVAYLQNRRTSGRDRDERAVRVNEHLWSLIAPKVAHLHCWYP